VRTYVGIDLAETFRLADSLGLAVVMGLDVPPYRHGYDYRDSATVARIKARVREQVLRYKDEPSLLMWGIGNEVTIFAKGEQVDAIARAINEISIMIHELDGRHPTTTMCGGDFGILDAWRKCPDLDVLSPNIFGSIGEFQSTLAKVDWILDKPILVSEWSPEVYWATQNTSWGAAIELNSEEKAFSYPRHYQKYLTPDRPLMIGSCLFLWGNKQEQTHTWFSAFSEEGEATTIVDEMTQVWRGDTALANHAPLVQAIQVGPYAGNQEVFLTTGEEYRAIGYAVDADGDSLTYDWEITQNYKRNSTWGGDQEVRPRALDELCLEQRGDTLYFRAPEESDAYRLYFYARDGKGKVGITNVNFFVRHPDGLRTTQRLSSREPGPPSQPFLISEVEQHATDE